MHKLSRTNFFTSLRKQVSFALVLLAFFGFNFAFLFGCPSEVAVKPSYSESSQQEQVILVEHDSHSHTPFEHTGHGCVLDRSSSSGQSQVFSHPYSQFSNFEKLSRLQANFVIKIFIQNLLDLLEGRSSIALSYSTPAFSIFKFTLSLRSVVLHV